MSFGTRSRMQASTGLEVSSAPSVTSESDSQTTGARLSSPKTPALAPGEPQMPLVPSTIDTSMMPGTTTDRQTTSLRTPVVIAGTGRRLKKASAGRPPTKRRMWVHAAVTVLLVMIVGGALAAVLPVGNGEAKGGYGLFNPIINMITSHRSDTSLIAAQAATATAVTQDGYDAGNKVYAGVQTAPTSGVPAQDSGNLNRFFYGQCTYWANMRYHQLTGHWIPWLGNAYQWAYQAPAYGWIESNQPNPNGPSVLVLAPYTQGTGAYGHVAVVERGVASASNGVLTSNWNWNGDWAREDWVTFYAGPGVKFVWYPGA